MTESDQIGWLVLRAQSGDREALDALLETARQLLHRYVLGVVLGISPGTVKSRLAYGLRTLRQAHREAAP